MPAPLGILILPRNIENTLQITYNKMVLYPINAPARTIGYSELAQVKMLPVDLIKLNSYDYFIYCTMESH